MLFNAAAAFLILERVDDLPTGYILAREVLLGGEVREWLDKAKTFYKAIT